MVKSMVCSMQSDTSVHYIGGTPSSELEDFVAVMFFYLQAFGDGNQHSWIKEKMLGSHTHTTTLWPSWIMSGTTWVDGTKYAGLHTRWLQKLMCKYQLKSNQSQICIRNIPLNLWSSSLFLRLLACQQKLPYQHSSAVNDFTFQMSLL